MIKKVTAVVQARIGSQRLRGKVLKRINNKETTNRIPTTNKIDWDMDVAKIIINLNLCCCKQYYHCHQF